MRCPLIFAACAFVAGTLLARYITIPASLSVSAAAICALFAILFRLKKRAVISTTFALMSVFLFALLNISVREHPPCAIEKFAETMPEQVQLAGKVCTEPQMVGPRGESGKKEWRFTIAVYESSEPADLHSREKPLGNVLAYWRSDSEDLLPHSGDTVRFFCRLYPLRRATNPGERDLWELSRGRGICARAYLKPKDKIEILARAKGSSFPRAVSAVRDGFRSVIVRSFGENSSEAAFLSAILVGDRTSLPQEKEEVYFKTGTVHILSISGLHVAVLAFFLFHTLRRLHVGQRPRAVTLALAVILYSLIGGLSIPLVRTTTIVLLYIVAELFLRQRNTLNILSAAAIIILAINPYDLFSVGFQLTFLGCLSLALFAPSIDHFLDRLRPKRRILLERLKNLKGQPHFIAGFARSWLSVSIAAWMGVQPLVTYYFHIFTPLSVVINTMIVPPVLLLALSLGFLLVILGSITIICATVISYPLGWLLSAFDGLLGLFSVPGMWFFLPNRFLPAVSLPALIAIYAALALLALKFTNVVRLKTVHIVTAFIIAFTVYLGVGLVAGESKESEFTVLDVGNGSAYVLREGGKTVLFDCGSTSRLRVGEEVIAPFLWNHGEDTIDAIFLSHSDTDHTNALRPLIDRFRIGCVLVSDYFDSNEQGKKILNELEARGIPVIRLEPRAKVEGIPGEIEVLAPVADELFGKKLSPNNSSVVIRTRICGKSFLLCADIEEAGIFILLETVKDVSAGVLQLPHHGRNRKSPLLGRLVRAANPEILFVSIARDEPFPSEDGEVFKSEMANRTFLSTAKSGAITFREGTGKILIEEFGKRRKSGRVDRNSISDRIAPEEEK
jgi:competence protein ComEC